MSSGKSGTCIRLYSSVAPQFREPRKASKYTSDTAAYLGSPVILLHYSKHLQVPGQLSFVTTNFLPDLQARGGLKSVFVGLRFDGSIRLRGDLQRLSASSVSCLICSTLTVHTILLKLYQVATRGKR